MRQTIATLMMIITLMTGDSQYGIAQIGISSISTLEGANLGEINLQMSDADPYQIEVSSADGDIVCTLSDVRSNSVTVCDGLAAGIYSIKITDRNSCEVLKTIEVMRKYDAPLPGKCLSWQVLLMRWFNTENGQRNIIRFFHKRSKFEFL